MGPRTLCGLFLCHLIWLSCGSPVEVVEGNAPTEGPEDLSFLQAEYNRVKDKLCNKKWKSHGFYCYRYFDANRTFSEAEEECGSHSPNGHLVSIHSMDQADFLATLVQNSENDVWIGLQTLRGSNGWNWTDNTTYNTKLTFWAKGEPHFVQNSNQACAQLTHDSGYLNWADADCGYTTGYICEISLYSS